MCLRLVDRLMVLYSRCVFKDLLNLEMTQLRQSFLIGWSAVGLNKLSGVGNLKDKKTKKQNKTKIKTKNNKFSVDNNKYLLERNCATKNISLFWREKIGDSTGAIFFYSYLWWWLNSGNLRFFRSSWRRVLESWREFSLSFLGSHSLAS